MTSPKPRVRNRRKRGVGWQSRDVVRTAALAMGLYYATRLFWFAHPLFLTAFLGVLFGLAVSSGVDHLARWRIPRGVGAAMVVLMFIGALVGFGAWVAPTIRAQSVEPRRRLPESIDRLEAWASRHNGGIIGSLISPSSRSGRRDSAQTATPRPAATGAAPAADADSSRETPLRQRISEQMSGATRYL